MDHRDVTDRRTLEVNGNEVEVQTTPSATDEQIIESLESIMPEAEAPNPGPGKPGPGMGGLGG